MSLHCKSSLPGLLLFAAAISAPAQANPADRDQPTRADYARALGLYDKYRELVQHLPDSPQWIDGSEKFVYRRTVPGGHEFILVDAEKPSSAKLSPQHAFDHGRLAAELGRQLKTPIKPEALPFTSPHLDSELKTLEFDRERDHWRCDLTVYSCARQPLPPDSAVAEDDGGYDSTPTALNGPERSLPSPDGKWEVRIENYNVVLLAVLPKPEDAKSRQRTDPAASHRARIFLSTDGSEGNYYAFDTLAWSPDSRHLAAYRIRPGYRRVVHYIESSPADQLQPKHSTMVYLKAGDVLPLFQPVLFAVEQGREFEIDSALFPNPYEMTPFEWRKDSRALTFEYNQRGHQLYRYLEVDAASGTARSVIDEVSDTVVNYPPLSRDQYDHGKHFRQDLGDGKEVLWASERDGWEHLYLFDGQTGALKNQVTRGPWVVRAVDRVDEATRTVYFEASGVDPGEDPYYVHGYKIQLDGSGMAPLTPAVADHTLSYSPDGKFFVDSYSRVDLPPVMELRRARDGGLVLPVDVADDTRLRAAGWRPPQPFHAPGRDGKTPIWGVIYPPANFDPTKKYPVVEDIYAGPQGSFVPKSFTSRAQPLTELGFVVVQIDGMGTNNRSRAFHDVAWRNLKDGGFLDRIAWHKAAAAEFSWYDAGRVGLFGTSAGAQNALAALLFHPEFYQAAVANCGSHDNRMDKIWWNEQWMGWPVGPWYAENSNVENASRLQGKLLLVVGEMDKNVDPSTTYQVADRLIKANKDFELMVVPGGGHGAGGLYGERKLLDFFVRNLLHLPTPDWNRQP